MGIRRLVVVLTAVALATSCSGGKDKGVAPSTTVPETTTTTAPVLPGPGNPRSTTTLPVELQGGQAGLIGTVMGPTGPVDGAIVRVERLVGDTVTGVDLQAQAGGRWELIGIRGGRYRLRAWRPPEFAQTRPDVFFLQATETKTVVLQVGSFGANTAEGTFTPPPTVGQTSTLAVLLSGSTVGPDGVVRTTPKPGTAVQLVGGGLALESPASQVTDGSGRASWRVRCPQPGPLTIALTAGATTVPLTAPPCGAPGPVTTSTTPR